MDDPAGQQQQPAAAAPQFTQQDGFQLQQEVAHLRNQMLLMAQQQQQTAAPAVVSSLSLPKPPKPDKLDGYSDTKMWEWISQMEVYLTALGLVGVPQAVDVAVPYFAGRYLTWYTNLRVQAAAAGKLPVFSSWEDVKTALLKQFSTVAPEKAALQVLERLKQTKWVAHYSAEFNRHVQFVHGLPEVAKIQMFCKGLQQHLRVYVDMSLSNLPEGTKPTLERAQCLAATAEGATRAQGSNSYHGHMGPRGNTGGGTSQSGPAPMELGVAQAAKGCWWCGKPGHNKMECKRYLRFKAGDKTAYKLVKDGYGNPHARPN
ncbi:MAG: hypothetical protein WCF18_04090 [Chthoniobacteraceae bacterium]|jgi:hypothetical protein